jgi:hypothetical protein
MGFVRRAPRPGDKPSYGIVLTPAGEVALQSITERVRAHDRSPPISTRLSGPS